MPTPARALRISQIYFDTLISLKTTPMARNPPPRYSRRPARIGTATAPMPPLEDLSDELRTTVLLNHSLRQMNEQQSEDISNKRKEIAHLEGVVEKKRLKLSEHESTIADNNQRITDLEAEVREKNRTIAALCLGKMSHKRIASAETKKTSATATK